MEPQLAAVLVADVAGYSRLMSANAEATLASLRRLRAELFGPAVAGHRGKLVKSMGDGWIVLYASAVDAVTCAMRLQDKLVLEPEIKIRMGIHIGDVTEEDEDVFGDGVNVAARLEGLCEPGGVAISELVFSTLDSTLRPAFDDAGEQALKNIPRPVRVWSMGGITGAAALKDRSGMDGFPRLDIVPTSLSNNSAEMTELANALTHDVSTYLGETRWLRTAVREIPGKDRFVMTSALRVSGERLRLEAKLVDPNGNALWSAKYDGTLEDVFDWQDETSMAIASNVLAKTSERMLAIITTTPEAERSWEDWLMLSLQGSRADYASFSQGLESAQKAIRMEPQSSYPYEFALAAWAAADSIGFKDLTDPYRDDVDSWARRAKDLAGAASNSRAMLAFFDYVRNPDATKARRDVDAFLRDLPFDAEALVFAGYLFNYMGEPRRALECFAKFDLIGGQHVFAITVRSGTGSAYAMLGRFEDALPEFEEAILLSPGYPAPHRWKAVVLAHLGRLDEAHAAMAEHNKLVPGLTVTAIKANGGLAETPDTQIYFDGLRMAGMPE